jgi:hypothetical protein
MSFGSTASTTLEEVGFSAPGKLSGGEVKQVLYDYHTTHDIDM